tara:strand:+ start:1283 stop:1693 length:411 start_codon:yes stop_codon:yes gene_type:complete
MKTFQLIYCSQPFGYNLEILSSILTTSRFNNKKKDITGALICREDIFLQLLEGPEDDIMLTYESIKRDDRHLNIYHILDHKVEQRLFPAWSMRDDPVKSWMWSREEVANGIVKNLPQGDVIKVFDKLSKESNIFKF